MHSPLSRRADDHEQQSDDDELNFSTLLDLEGNFISLFLGDASPSEPDSMSPFPFASVQPDASRTLTRLTQRLALDINTRKLGHDAYASSSSDAEEDISSSFVGVSKVHGKESSTKGNASGGSKSKDGAKAARDGRVGSDEARLGTKLKKSSVVLTDEQELDGFVVADGEVLSE
jgi:hypothetical protein